MSNMKAMCVCSFHLSLSVFVLFSHLALFPSYRECLTGDDEEAKMKCAKAWTRWEMTTSQLEPEDAKAANADDGKYSLAFARIENHYFINGGFFPSDAFILDNVNKEGGEKRVERRGTAAEHRRGWREQDQRNRGRGTEAEPRERNSRGRNLGKEWRDREVSGFLYALLLCRACTTVDIGCPPPPPPTPVSRLLAPLLLPPNHPPTHSRLHSHPSSTHPPTHSSPPLPFPPKVYKIRHIPTVIVQGRYDVVCPAKSAWDLHREFPESKLHLVQTAGHSCYEKGITSKLVQATNDFAK